MRYLLDTNIVIDHLTGRQSVTQLLTQLLPEGAGMSIITFSEIYEGIYGSREPRAAARAFATFLTGVSVLSISRAVAKRAARVRLELRRRGRPLSHRALDLLIAATDLEHHLILVTRNARDYADITDLEQHPWT